MINKFYKYKMEKVTQIEMNAWNAPFVCIVSADESL